MNKYYCYRIWSHIKDIRNSLIGTEKILNSSSFLMQMMKMNYIWEIKKGANKIVNELIKVKEGEELLIYADTTVSPIIVDSTAEQAFIAGARPVVMWYETLKYPGEEPPAIVAGAMKNADA
ncbi:MAG: hypothetical protein QW478_03965, partial [Candidatus Micrarchaeaceae archaeon]